MICTQFEASGQKHRKRVGKVLGGTFGIAKLFLMKIKQFFSYSKLFIVEQYSKPSTMIGNRMALGIPIFFPESCSKLFFDMPLGVRMH